MQTVRAAKELKTNFPIETTTKWILGLCYPEVITRTDGESSIVALSRRVGEKHKVKQVSKQCSTQAQHTKADHQDTQRVVSEF